MSAPADTNCRKCKAPMPPLPPADGPSAHLFAAMTITAFRCDRCGHWNDLKRRKAKATP